MRCIDIRVDALTPDDIEALAAQLLAWQREHPEIFDDGMPELLRRLTPDEKRTLLKMAGVTDDRVPEAEVRRRLGLDR